MSVPLPPSLVTVSCYQPKIQKHSSLLLLKSFFAPNSSFSSFLKNDLKNATNNACKSLIRASGSTISSVTVERDVTDSTVFVIRVQDKSGFLDVITRVLKGVKIEKPTIQFDEEEDCFVIKFLVTDLNGNKIENEESLIKIENALTEAINGGALLRKPGFLGGKSKSDRMFELMYGFLKNDPDSRQIDILHHVEYTVARSRFSFDDFEAYQVNLFIVFDLKDDYDYDYDYLHNIIRET